MSKVKRNFKNIKIEGLHIENVKCFKDVEITFDKSSSTHIILGTNGRGKSTILQLIALGLTGIESLLPPHNWKEVIKKGSDYSRLELHLSVEGEPLILKFQIDSKNVVTCVDGSDQLNRIKDSFLLLAYGVNRSIKLETTQPFKELEPIATLFGENRYLKNIQSSATYEHVIKNFSNLQTLINTVLEIADPEYPVVLIDYDSSSFYFKTASTRDAPIPIEALSEGFKSTFVWLFDAIIRIVERGGNIENAADITGIIMVDEIDLHLHPSWQRTILNSVQSLFPKIQFIVTTHSPFVVQSANSNCLISLETDTETGNIIVVDKDTSRGLSYEAMAREIFNIPSLFSVEIEEKMNQFVAMTKDIRSKKEIDEQKFKSLVLEIAGISEELKGIVHLELLTLEKRTGKKFDVWKK